MENLQEVKEIVNRYIRLNTELSDLLFETERLNQKRIKLQEEIELTKLEEVSLIDKITKETGTSPDYFKIMQELNGNSIN